MVLRRKKCLNWGYTGLTNYYGTWYYVENSILNWNFTGLTDYYGTKYYVENGVLNWNYTGLALLGSDEWYYAENGAVKTIIRAYIFCGRWFYVEKALLVDLRVLPIITAQSIMWKTASSIGIIRGLHSLGAINGTMLKRYS